MVTGTIQDVKFINLFPLADNGSRVLCTGFWNRKTENHDFCDTPPNPEFALPKQAKNLVMHTELNITGSNVMFSDTFPGTPFIAGNNFSLAIISKNMDEIKSLFNKLKEGGKIDMDLQETFWSKCYGQLTDKYGIGWQFSHDNGES